MSGPGDRYGPVAIGLHWATAITVAALWLIGQLNDNLPRGPLRLGIWSAHVTLGFLLVPMLAASLVARWRRPAVAWAGTTRLAGAAHIFLYAALALVAGLGLWQAFLRGFNMFGLFDLPTLPGGRDLARAVNGWHGLLANAVAGAAALHAMAALYHHYIRRDAVLARMVPRLRRHTHP